MIYLDYAATTPCAQEVIDAMLPYFRQKFANASSIDHRPGSEARAAVERARSQVAELFSATPEEVIFTSGSTEANNLLMSATIPVVTTSVEHPSILDPFKRRRNPLDKVVRVPRTGLVELAAISSEVERIGPCLLSILATNNETGVEQDLSSLVSFTRSNSCLLHLDATQAIITRDVSVSAEGADACSVSAHKIKGPKGIGALIVRPELRRYLRAILDGGGHERGLRSGTLNVPGIVGFGAAAALLARTRSEGRNRLVRLRTLFIESLQQRLGAEGILPVTALSTASPHILSLRLPGVNNRALLRSTAEELAFSLGSACATNKNQPSPVLLAMGLGKIQANEIIRCSFSPEQSEEEILESADIIASAATALARMSVTA